MVAELQRAVDLNAIARVDNSILTLPTVDCRTVTGRFTPGLYSREIILAAGCRYRSKVHKTEHQFIISQGACVVRENDGEPVLVLCGYHGVTTPGTWRDIFVVMDTKWTTFHATDKTTAEEVEREITEPTEEKQ